MVADFAQPMQRFCMLVFTENWLDNAVSNNELAIDGFTTPFHVDQDKLTTGKEHGGAVCIYLNNSWCNKVIMWDKICEPDIELLALSLHPFYLLLEFP